MEILGKSNDPKHLFETVSVRLNAVQLKYADADSEPGSDPETARLAVVANSEQVEISEDDESGQTGDVSGKIADLNDRFRLSDPNSNGDIPGEWVLDADVKALAPTVKGAIKRKIRETPPDGFADCPLHDHGRVEHQTKQDQLVIVWVIRTYADSSMLRLATHPEDPDQSYRVLAVTLSDEARGE